MTRSLQGVQHPVVQRPVIFELQGTERVGNPLNGVAKTMGVVIHRIDAPLVSGPVVGDLENPVQNRIPHIDI